jgi:hypothetical protein
MSVILSDLSAVLSADLSGVALAKKEALAKEEAQAKSEEKGWQPIKIRVTNQ